MSTITRLTAARRLAQSSSPLADVLIDSVRREADGTNKTSGNAAGGPGQLALALEDDDAADAGAGVDLLGAPPSRYAVAVLLGRAFDADRAGVARLQDSDAVTLIEVPSADMVEPVQGLLRRHVLQPVNVINPAELRKGGICVAGSGTVEIFADRDDGRPAKPEHTEDLVQAARAGCAVIAISADAERLLPPALVRMATARIALPRFDAGLVRAVIQAVTAIDPGPVDAGLAGGLTLQALDLAVRADLGAEASLRRLSLLVGSQEKDDSIIPIAEMHGLGQAKTWALDLIADIKAYKRGDLPWKAISARALIFSRPGCGKTALARALAREAGVAFIATSYSEWQAHREGHLGDVTRAIRNVFAEAKRTAPSIIFIDEIDTIVGRGRSKRDESWWHACLTVLLEEIDGYDRREGIAIISACNDPSRLDPALVRAGRLDRLIEIPLPDVPALAGILRTYLGRELEGEDFIDVALTAHGSTGADVERWVRDARAVARRANRAITKADLLAVVRDGRRELPEAARRRVATHEAGHTCAIVATGSGTPVSISISDKGGLSQNEPGERRALTRSHLEEHLVFLLAGRAAELLVYGEGTAGAGGSEGSDLARATALATELETSYGLGTSGLLYAPIESQSHYLLAPAVREAVKMTLDRALKTAMDLLARNRVTLDALANALFERGYLDAQAIEHVLDRYPLQPAERRSPPRTSEPPLTSSLEPADDDYIAPSPVLDA